MHTSSPYPVNGMDRKKKREKKERHFHTIGCSFDGKTSTFRGARGRREKKNKQRRGKERYTPQLASQEEGKEGQEGGKRKWNREKRRGKTGDGLETIRRK